MEEPSTVTSIPVATNAKIMSILDSKSYKTRIILIDTPR